MARCADDPFIRRLVAELARPRVRTTYCRIVARSPGDASGAVRTVREWAALHDEAVIRPGSSPPREADLHRHLILLLLGDPDRSALETWLSRAAATSPRAHLVLDLDIEALARPRACRSGPGCVDAADVMRLIEAGEFIRADAWIATHEVLARAAQEPEAEDVRVAKGWLRFWQGRFEEALAGVPSASTSSDGVLLRAMVAWACGQRDLAITRLLRARGDGRLALLVGAERALAGGDRVSAVRMLGPPAGDAHRTWLCRTLADRVRARASGNARVLSASNRDLAARRAYGLGRWGLGRPSMYLMHALESLLTRVNDCDDERAGLVAVCGWAREHAGADAAVVIAGDDGGMLAGEGWRRDGLTAEERRAITRAGAPLTLRRADGLVVSAPVRYGGARIAAMVLMGPPERQETMAEAAGAVAAVSASAVRARLTSLAISGNGEALARDILGRSPAMQSVREAIARAAVTPFPVLIEGESGTGKELAARALHRLSPRRDRRLAALNCAALSDELAEAELFGHARGAFTGAVAARAGLFEDAHGGTLFLDEVGELSPRAQAKLLRTLQEREVRRLGENASRAVDVRVVAATNRSLPEMAAAGGFRDDLLFRLAVIRLRLPPLRERTEDIPTLAHVFWRAMMAEANKRAVLGADAVARLVCHRWPGNVRELQNVIAGLIVLAPGRGRVGARHVEHVLAASGARPIEPPVSLACARRQAERRTIAAALARHRGRRAAAARELGVTRQGLSKAVRRLHLLPGGGVSEGVA
ncbi:MAG: sigma 54-interacting transcriptional regulator [Acidobacteriota bacterium]